MASFAKTTPAWRCRRKFKRYFKHGFQDETYLAWERDYKWQAHLRWQADLPPTILAKLARDNPLELARRAVTIASRTNLLFSFEKMALRDAVRDRAGATRFALALCDFLQSRGSMEASFDAWCSALGE